MFLDIVLRRPSREKRILHSSEQIEGAHLIRVSFVPAAQTSERIPVAVARVVVLTLRAALRTVSRRDFGLPDEILKYVRTESTKLFLL